MRRSLFLVAVLSLILGGCSGAEILQEEMRFGQFPGCDTTRLGRRLLMAQAIPDTQYVPCLGELPPGWEYRGGTTRSSYGSLRLETDVYDVTMEIVLEESCDVADAVGAESDRASAEYYVREKGEGLSEIYTFAGGCIHFEWPTDALADSAHAAELRDVIGFTSRDELREISGWEL